MNNRIAAALLFLVAAAVNTPSISATEANRLTLSDLVKDSQSVLIGTPTTIRNRISVQGNVFTEVTLSAVEGLRNGQFLPTGRPYTLLIWGGVQGANGEPATFETPPPHRITMFHGTPLLQLNERHLLFVSGNGERGLPFEHADLGAYVVKPSGRLESSYGATLINSLDALDSTLFVKENNRLNAPLTLEIVSSDINGLVSSTTPGEPATPAGAALNTVKSLIENLNPNFVDPAFTTTEETRVSAFMPR